MTRRMALLPVAAVLAIVAGLAFGASEPGPAGLVSAVRDPGSIPGQILLQLRLPRVLLAFAVGSGLGVTGAVLQALVRNPLADPYLLGLSGGAGLGAVIAIAAAVTSPWGVPVAAFLGAIGAVLLVYRVSLVGGRRLDPRVLLLGGVVVGAFAGALMSAIISLSPAPQLRSAWLWLMGGFGGASWQALAVFGAYSAVPAVLLFVSARHLDLLVLGEETAQYLGTDIERIKRMVYFAASLLTAAAVAVSGVIGFVGLVVPHAVRLMIGPLHVRLLPAVALASGAFLVLADLVARTVVRPLELPVGVVTAVVGVPLFVVLLRRTQR
ncbi:MAG TPA: iron ABC transporter permease [Gemmatimonadales bacterium]